jgi:uncharacterized protein
VIRSAKVHALDTGLADHDFAGLRLLRDKLGSAFVGGAVVNLNQRSYTYEDRLHVLPLDRLWTMPAGDDTSRRDAI